MNVRRWLFENSLSLFFLSLFLVTLGAQSLAGQHAFNEQQAAHKSPPIGWLDYVTSSDFGRAVMENWQSEFLQFFVFIGATIWLVQKGSNESKQLDEVGLESGTAEGRRTRPAERSALGEGRRLAAADLRKLAAQR